VIASLHLKLNQKAIKLPSINNKEGRSHSHPETLLTAIALLHLKLNQKAIAPSSQTLPTAIAPLRLKLKQKAIAFHKREKRSLFV
jgi:hypothetical protein